MQQDGTRDSKDSSKSGAASAELEFVLVDQPTKRATGDVRRRVRSHVTKLQHQKTREKEIISHSGPARPFIPYARLAERTKSDVVKPSAKPTGVKKAKSHSVATERPALSKRRNNKALNLASSNKQLEESDDRAVAKYGESYWEGFGLLASSSLGTAFSRGTMSFRTFALDDSTNTVGMSLEALGLDLSSVLGCYKLIVQIQSRDFEQHYSPHNSGVIVWERFYRFVFSDPVLLTVALLITIRYRLECLGYRNRARDFMQVLLLEDFLIQRVNAALKQPGRAVSDPMLVAVALCAAYEVKNGNPAAYHIHMKGLMRMIDLRGGMEALYEDDPYLERMLIWHDVNTSQIVGHEGYLLHLPNSLGEARPESNLPTFRAPIETDADARASSEEATSAASGS